MSSTVRKVPEPLRALAKKARKLKWHIDYSGSDHLRWTPPADWPHPLPYQARYVTTSSTPRGGRHTIQNDRRSLHRAGL